MKSPSVSDRFNTDIEDNNFVSKIPTGAEQIPLTL
jgi:hypothetical protein